MLSSEQENWTEDKNEDMCGAIRKYTIRKNTLWLHQL